jgi:hypothetical protein
MLNMPIKPAISLFHFFGRTLCAPPDIFRIKKLYNHPGETHLNKKVEKYQEIGYLKNQEKTIVFEISGVILQLNYG